MTKKTAAGGCYYEIPGSFSLKFPSLHSYLSSTVLSMTLGPILAIFVSLRVDPSILLISFAFLFCVLLLFVSS